MHIKNKTIEILDSNSSFDEWDTFIDNSPQGSIFGKSWWLKAVCPKGFLIPVIKDKTGIICGFPLPLQSRLGLKFSVMPKYTQTLGPFFKDLSHFTEANRIALENELIEELIINFPNLMYIKNNLHFSVKNLLPFIWNGFNTSVRYTYVIDNKQPLHLIYQNVASNYKNKINKALKNGLEVTETNDIDLFIKTIKSSMDQIIRLDYQLIKRLDKACKENCARKIYLVREKSGIIHSGLYAVYNKNYFFNLFQGGDPELRKSGSNILALWHSITDSRNYSLFYDFEGSILKNIEPVFRNMGGTQVPYYEISKSKLNKIGKCTKDLIKKMVY